MSILVPYLVRNLRANGGVVDELLVITKNRDSASGMQASQALLDDVSKRFPGAVRQVPFCRHPYGCAYNEIMVDPNAVYVKLDDDLLFVKDGSFEHLVYQVSARV